MVPDEERHHGLAVEGLVRAAALQQGVALHVAVVDAPAAAEALEQAAFKAREQKLLA